MDNYDPAKVYFITESTIDKILVDPTTYSRVVAGGGPAAPTTVNTTVAHNQTTPVVANGMFSTDGTNFYPCGLRIQGGNSALSAGQAQYVLCDMYTNATNVTIYITNGFDAAQTVYYYFTVESLT